MQQTTSEEVILTTRNRTNANQRARSFPSTSRPHNERVTRILTNSRRSPEHQFNHSGPIYYGGGNPANSPDLLNFRSRQSLNHHGVLPHIHVPSQSTPIHAINFPHQHETFGSQIDYNLSWMPKDVTLSDLIDSGFSPRNLKKSLPEKYLRDPNLELQTSSAATSRVFEQSSNIKDPRFLINLPNLKEERSPKKSRKLESLIEWFDRTVEQELRKRREGSLNIGENYLNLEPSRTAENLASRKLVGGGHVMLDASSSHIDISAGLRTCQDTDLSEAIDKLSKAEAMFAFEGAVKAAEEAAASAPSEFAEEAAAAGAQEYQAEVIDVVKEEYSGAKPVEVVGYVGITRPKKHKKI